MASLLSWIKVILKTNLLFRDYRNNLNQPPIYSNLGGLLKLGDTPRPPAGSILYLFSSGLI